MNNSIKEEENSFICTQMKYVIDQFKNFNSKDTKDKDFNQVIKELVLKGDLGPLAIPNTVDKQVYLHVKK